MHPKKLVPFFRLNPRIGWKEEIKRRVEEGFMGIKLHPHSQNFGIASPQAMEIYAAAEHHDLPVLVHTGYGLNEISNELGDIIKNFPKLRLILGHAAFVDMDNIIKKLSKSKYVVFETSATSVLDLYNLIDVADRNGIMFGSDMPYIDCGYSLESVVHVASTLNINMRDLGKILSWNAQKWFE